MREKNYPIVCTYDNPATCRRECWQDGKCIISYSYELFFLKEGGFNDPRIARKFLFFGANIGDWKDGQFQGHPAAMPCDAPGFPFKD